MKAGSRVNEVVSAENPDVKSIWEKNIKEHLHISDCEIQTCPVGFSFRSLLHGSLNSLSFENTK